jgi:hypothetical protein
VVVLLGLLLVEMVVAVLLILPELLTLVAVVAVESA